MRKTKKFSGVWFLNLFLMLGTMVGLSLLRNVTTLRFAMATGLILAALTGIGKLILFLRKETEEKKVGKLVFLYSVTLYVMLGSILFLSMTILKFTYLEESFLPFWEIALLVGVVLGVFAAVKFVAEDAKIGARVGVFFVTLFLSFIATAMLGSALNYVLDSNEPQEIVTLIENKDIDRRRKGPDSYEFIVTVDGQEVTLEVSSAVYKRYEIGDFYRFSRYEGAFGEPFIVAD